MQVHTIDLKFQNVEGVIGAFLIDCGGELALIETGPGSCLDTLRMGIEDLGYSVSDIKKVMVTHIHLDHAGAAGWWAEQGATIYVHYNGARHLIDPSRLMESARMIYKDRMDELWGEMVPIAEDQVVSLDDGDEIQVGDAVFIARDTPGHARHHHVFICDGVAFTGDVAGARLDGDGHISVTSAPPQFDPEAYDQSIQTLLDGNYSRLYLTHFGEVADVEDHLKNYREAVKLASNFVAQRLGEGMNEEELQVAYEAFQMERAFQAGAPPKLWSRYQIANPTAMSADGIRMFHEKQKAG